MERHAMLVVTLELVNGKDFCCYCWRLCLSPSRDQRRRSLWGFKWQAGFHPDKRLPWQIALPHMFSRPPITNFVYKHIRRCSPASAKPDPRASAEYRLASFTCTNASAIAMKMNAVATINRTSSGCVRFASSALFSGNYKHSSTFSLEESFQRTSDVIFLGAKLLRRCID